VQNTLPPVAPGEPVLNNEPSRAQPVASSLPPGVSYATTPVEPVLAHALQLPQIGSLAAMSELVIPQREPWEPMSEFSDDPISLYAQSELDVCYANDPFTSTEVDSRLPTEETLESFNAEWNYLEGKLNILADAFSRLPRFDYSGPERKKNELSMDQVPFDPQAPAVMESAFCDPYLDLIDDAALSACLSHFVEADHQFANFPSTVQNPLRYQWLQKSQNKSPQLLQQLVDDPTHFRRRSFGRSGKAYEFYALTCIDRASGFPDGIPITRKTSEHVSNKFNECWLSRYPRPEVCAHDQGGEFIGPEFHRDMLHNLPVTFDLDTINQRRQLRIDKDIQRINSKRYSYDYQVGQQRINIRRVKPYKSPTTSILHEKDPP
jgi:hypothetical protein